MVVLSGIFAVLAMRYAAGHEVRIGILRVLFEYFADGGQGVVVFLYDKLKLAELEQGRDAARKALRAEREYVDGAFGVVGARIVEQHIGEQVVVNRLHGVDVHGLLEVGQGFVEGVELVVHFGAAEEQGVVVGRLFQLFTEGVDGGVNLLCGGNHRFGVVFAGEKKQDGGKAEAGQNLLRHIVVVGFFLIRDEKGDKIKAFIVPCRR